jgi:hypothetical protein
MHTLLLVIHWLYRYLQTLSRFAQKESLDFPIKLIKLNKAKIYQIKLN